MPRLHLPAPHYGPLTPRECVLMEAMLTWVNDLRDALGLPLLTLEDCESAWAQPASRSAQEER